MQTSSRELWWALAAIAAITAVYLVAVKALGVAAAASSLLGHGIGILGFILMLMTETLYSLRKRSQSARWGRTALWLQFHIFTGLVGPYMVFLHSAWQFRGLAGIVMLMTVIIVISGVIGRYIYTAVPRTDDGIQLERSQLEAEMAALEDQMRLLALEQPEGARMQLESPAPETGGTASLFLAQSTGVRRSRVQLWWQRRKLPKDVRDQRQALDRMAVRQKTLQRQLGSLSFARRALGIWHAIHIPLGLALFTAAFVHAGAALYFVLSVR